MLARKAMYGILLFGALVTNSYRFFIVSVVGGQFVEARDNGSDKEEEHDEGRDESPREDPILRHLLSSHELDITNESEDFEVYCDFVVS